MLFRSYISVYMTYIYIYIYDGFKKPFANACMKLWLPGKLPETFRKTSGTMRFRTNSLQSNNELVPDPSQGRRETRGTRRRGTRRGPRRGTEEGRLGDAWETVGDGGGRRGTEGKGNLPENFRKPSGKLPAATSCQPGSFVLGRLQAVRPEGC